MTTYEILTGELVRVVADNRQDAMEQLADGNYESLEILSDFRSESCDCEQPDARGWHKGDDLGITFEGLKRAQNQSAQEMAQYIAHIYFTKSNEAFIDLMNLIVDNESSPFGGYSETCEWQHDTKPCRECQTARVDADIYDEELGLCLTCSDAYWSHDEEERN